VRDAAVNRSSDVRNVSATWRSNSSIGLRWTASARARSPSWR